MEVYTCLGDNGGRLRMIVRKYVGRVETFLVAGGEMNVYMGIASFAAIGFCIVTCMYTAQNRFE